MGSMYEQFGTDPRIEREGVIVDYGDFRITIARAGGANKRYQKLLDAKTRPMRRAIQTDTLDPERAMGVLKQVYADAVVRNWEIKDENGEWAQGIEGPNGDVLPFNRDNVLNAFNQLDDLFQDVMEQAQKAALFRVSVQEALSGNS